MIHLNVPVQSRPLPSLTVGLSTMATVMPGGGGGGGFSPAPPAPAQNLSSFGPYGTPPHGAPVLQPQPSGSTAISYGPQNLPGGARTFGYRRAWPGAWGGWGWPGWGWGGYWGAPIAVYPATVPDNAPATPATPEEVFGTRLLTQEQADEWCRTIYWPWCRVRGGEEFCHRYAAQCVPRINGN